MFFNLNKFSGLGFVGRNLVCYLVEHDLCSKVNNCKWRNSLDHHFENFDNNINQPFFIMCFCNKCNFLILIGSKHKQQVCMKLNWHLLEYRVLTSSNFQKAHWIILISTKGFSQVLFCLLSLLMELLDKGILGQKAAE